MPITPSSPPMRGRASRVASRMALILAGAAVLPMDAAGRLIPAADLHIEGTDIAAIEPAGAARRPEDEVIDCRRTLITPGLVNTHTHAYAALLRGLAEDKPRSFWSDFYGVPGQEKYGIEHFVAAAGAACAEFLLNGVTCIADRYGPMDRIGAAIEASGIRAVLGPTISDLQGAADWRITEAVLERWGTAPERRISAGIAPHALDSCSDELLRRCAREAERRQCRLFIHVAQSEREVERVRARGHEGALGCLTANGLTGPHVVAAHGIYLTDDEVGAWPASGISIAHCPASNIKIEGRTIPLPRFIGKVAIGLGTDWALTNNSMDLLAECRLAAFVGKLRADDPMVLPVETMLRMATIDGARVLGLDRLIGSIEPGKRADLVVWDLDRLPMSPGHDLAANLLYSADTRCVRDVLVDGTPLVRNGHLTKADEKSLALALNQMA